MKTTRKNCKDEFIKSLLCDDPKSLVETWHNRSNDHFYAILSNIRDIVDDEFIHDSEQTNPILYPMLAYCFDGDKKKTYEKTKNIVAEYVAENNYSSKYDKLVNALVDLDNESQYDAPVEFFSVDEKIPISSMYDFVLSGFDPDYGISGKDIRIEIVDEKIQFYFDAYADDEDMQWLNEKLFIKEDEDAYDYKKQNMIISLKRKSDDMWYDLLYLTDSTPLGYVDHIADNEILTIVCKADAHYFSTETDDEFVNAIQKSLENRLDCIMNPTECGDIDEDGESIDLCEKSTTLDMLNVNDLNFILYGYYNDDITEFYTMKLTYSNLSDFKIELSHIIGDEETKNFHKTLLMPLMTLPTKRGYVSKSTVVHDMKIDLYDSEDGKSYHIVDLNNAYVTSYEDDTICITSDTFFIAANDNDQVANYVRAQLANVLYNVYRDGNSLCIHNRLFNEYA